MIRRLIPGVARKNKIFFVGFSKCGTTALHYYLRKNGIRSLHSHHKGLYAATIIEQNLIRGRDPLRYLSQFEAFSDMLIASDTAYTEAIKYYKEFYEFYPDSYFVYNDRPVDDWIKSRFNHTDFADRQARYFKVDKSELADVWRQINETHKRETMEFFRDKPKFMHFNIDTDDIRKLTTFLRPDYHFRNFDFKKVNVTK